MSEKTIRDRIKEEFHIRDSYFKDHPVRGAIIPISLLVVVTSTAEHVWSRIYVCLAALFTIGSQLTTFIWLIAFCTLIIIGKKYTKAASIPPKNKNLKIFGTSIILVGILLTILSGPIMGDKYVWIKEEALTALNTSNFKHKSVKCTKVDISYDKYNVYYGLATLDNGQVQNIEVRYKTQNKGTGRYYYSIFDFYVKQVK